MYLYSFTSSYSPLMNLGGLYTFEQNIFLLENRNMPFEERIVEKDFSNSLNRFARTLAMDIDRADDLVQQTYFKLLEKKDQFKEGDDPLPWAITIMKNIFKDSFRKKTEFQLSEEGDTQVASGEEQENLMVQDEESKSLKSRIDYCISKLSNIDREIVAFWQADLSYAQVAESLKITLGNARQRFSRAKETLRLCLEAQNA